MGAYGCQEACLKHRDRSKGQCLSGRKEAAAQRVRSPGKELQVQPVGPCASGEGEHISRSLFLPHLYLANPAGVTAAMFASKSSSGSTHFLLLSDTAVLVQSLRPASVPL